jgi:hypothetical protein
MTACGDEITDKHPNRSMYSIIYPLHYKMQIRFNCLIDNEKVLKNGGEIVLKEKHNNVSSIYPAPS